MIVLQDGETPLHLAACKAHLPVVEFLVQSGAGVDKGNEVYNSFEMNL